MNDDDLKKMNLYEKFNSSKVKIDDQEKDPFRYVNITFKEG